MRTYDIDSLLSPLVPEGLHRLPIAVGDGPRTITGIQKMVQRYVSTLLTQLESIGFDQAYGTDFWRDVARGVSQNAGAVESAFMFANSDVMTQMAAEDDNTDLYGPIADDERLVSANLLDFNLDLKSGVLYISVELESQSGDTYSYSVPVNVRGT